jgi:N4-gp56 family major capsid protein
MARSYNDPAGGTPSQVGTQFRTDHYVKKALIEARELQYFMPLADVTSMPKNMGKKIKKYHYLPLLDDENINDQGIDASGSVISDGNLYGSSTDIGTIPGKLPTLTENGGRVNRVGFKRKEIEGTIEKFGFFDEYTQESVDFDTDGELRMHVAREMLNGATEMTEDALQIDLLNAAGVVRYAGDATTDAELDSADVVDYNDLLALHITLTDNHTPMKTKVITGTRMVDTRTVAGGRVLYIGSELQPVVEAMVDLHGQPAFTPIHQYAAGATPLNGEIGSVGYFRVVIVPKMLKWADAGAASPTAGFYGSTNYDVFPMLCVGNESFTTIGFQTDGKTVKFKIYNKPPGEENADRSDPYGETGFMSCKWYYGFMVQRPERLGLVKTVGQMA